MIGALLDWIWITYLWLFETTSFAPDHGILIPSLLHASRYFSILHFKWARHSQLWWDIFLIVMSLTLSPLYTVAGSTLTYGGRLFKFSLLYTSYRSTQPFDRSEKLEVDMHSYLSLLFVCSASASRTHSYSYCTLAPSTSLITRLVLRFSNSLS